MLPRPKLARMQSDLLGAHAVGLRNVIVITGDPPKLGDTRRDACSTWTARPDEHVDAPNRGSSRGNPIGAPTGSSSRAA